MEFRQCQNYCFGSCTGLSPNLDFLSFAPHFSLLPLWLPCFWCLVALSPTHPWQPCHTGAGHKDALAREACQPGLPQGEGGEKARSCTPCSLGRALLPPQLGHHSRGAYTVFKVALPGTCTPALGTSEQAFFPLDTPLYSSVLLLLPQ